MAKKQQISQPSDYLIRTYNDPTPEELLRIIQERSLHQTDLEQKQ